MKKIIAGSTIILFAALTSVLGILYAAPPVAGTPQARSMYSTRQYRPPVPQRQYAVQDIVVAPSLAPEQTDKPNNADPALDPRNMRSSVAPVPPSTPATGTERPLSGISTERPQKSSVGSRNTSRDDSWVDVKPAPKKPGSKGNTDASEFSSGSSIDKMYASLAKIQLEKKNLPETLRLLDKITSPLFKVATLTEFAEYVSRDVNYRTEAERLYALAIDGIDALQNGRPVNILVPASALPTTVSPPAPEPIQPPLLPSEPIKIETIQPILPKPKPEPIKIEPIKPIPLEPPVSIPEPPKPETVKPEPPKPEPVKVEPVKPEPPKPEPVKVEPVKPEPPKKEVKPVLEPLDEPEPVKPEPAKPETKPEPAKEPTLAPEQKPEQVKPEPVKPEELPKTTEPVKPEPAKAEELPKAEEPKAAPRKPSLFETKKEEDKPEPVKTESVKPESKALEELKPAEPSKSEEPAAKEPTRRPMPRKAVKLEEN